eukprot:scaffold33_cov123-Amphora_coffeaeformis.AAC.2
MKKRTVASGALCALVRLKSRGDTCDEEASKEVATEVRLWRRGEALAEVEMPRLDRFTGVIVSHGANTQQRVPGRYNKEMRTIGPLRESVNVKVQE